MKKLILCLGIASIISTQAFALEIYKGHITSHREWTTGNSKGYFIPMDSRKQLSTKMNQSSKEQCGGDSFRLSHDISPITAKVGDFVTVKGYHAIYMENKSEIRKNYKYTHMLCTMTSQDTLQCASYEEGVELEPRGYIASSSESKMPLTFDKAGQYHTSVRTNIEGVSDTQISISGDSESFVTIL